MPDFWILSLMAAIAASSSLAGSSRSCMLVKPSALTHSRFESEYWARTPSLGFQLGTRGRCWAWAATAADIAVSTVRRVRVTKRRYQIKDRFAFMAWAGQRRRKLPECAPKWRALGPPERRRRRRCTRGRRPGRRRGSLRERRLPFSPKVLCRYRRRTLAPPH